jgi:hypothetical protein
MAKKQRRNLSTRQRQGLGVLALLQITLLALAQWDLSRRSNNEINGNKLLWRALVFINFVGPIAYFVFGRKR